MRKCMRGSAWFVAGCLVLLSSWSFSDVVHPVPITPSSPVTTGVQANLCAPMTFAAAQQQSSCSSCGECVSREGQTDRCLAICERLGCDPSDLNPSGRCDVIFLCVIGYRWDPNACRCVVDPSGN